MNKNIHREVPKDVRNLARLLDTQFSIGNFRFGLDPLLGLIPGIGDFISLLLSGGLLAMAARHGASRKLLILMSVNVFFDAVIGSIPVLGGIFDFFYKANTRNVRLLEKHYHKRKIPGKWQRCHLYHYHCFAAANCFGYFPDLEIVQWLFTAV